MSGRSRDWDLPIFRPQMGRRVRGSRTSTDLPFRTAVFLKLARGFGRAGNSGRQSRARCDVRLPPNARRCVVKARYVPMGDRGPKAARAHLAYIERDGVERDGSPGRMFGPEGEVRRVDFGAPIAGERRQFRFITSAPRTARRSISGTTRVALSTAWKKISAASSGGPRSATTTPTTRTSTWS